MSWFWKDKEKSSYEHQSGLLWGQTPSWRPSRSGEENTFLQFTQIVSPDTFFSPRLLKRGWCNVCSIYNVNMAERQQRQQSVSSLQSMKRNRSLKSITCALVISLWFFFSSVYLSSSYLTPEKRLFLLTEHRGSLGWIRQAAAAVRGISLLVTVKQFSIWKQRVKNHS